MTNTIELLRQGRTQELWQKYCGFIDLSLEEFMEIQERLVMEQIEWFGKCELGKKIIGEPLPTSVEEFRQRMPLTTYADYAPYLLEKREDVLPEKPLLWMRTSGRSGEYQCKWAPMFEEGWRAQAGPVFLASMIFASCRDRGDFILNEGDKMPYCMAPRPYSFGWLGHALLEEFPFVLLPPEEVAEKMSFQERIEKGFELAFKEGIDVFFGLTSVLVKIAEQFSEGSERRRKFSLNMLHPKVLYRLTRGLIRSKLAKRPMYPKDLWDVKGIVAGGTDTVIFKDKITEYWGVQPLEMYGGTELGMIAVQTWDHDGMTFLPDVNFLEFIPEDEHIKSREDPSYQPRTVLLNEVEAGKRYELVNTNLKIGAFIRYRVGDMVRITALRNEKLDIDIPQMVFEGRCDDIIDLAGFTRMTEKVIWQAIEKAQVGYEEWTIRKEIEEQQPVLHLYIELKRGSRSREEIEEAVHRSLKDLDPDYRDIEEMLHYKPLRVTVLSHGTFQRYLLDRQKAGVEPAHYKPPHMVSSDKVIDRLLQMSAPGMQG
jgi:hypothetical protein